MASSCSGPDPCLFHIYGCRWHDGRPGPSPEWQFVEVGSPEEKAVKREVNCLAGLKADGRLEYNLRGPEWPSRAEMELVVAAWRGSRA